jgi:hypothetical protein
LMSTRVISIRSTPCWSYGLLPSSQLEGKLKSYSGQSVVFVSPGSEVVDDHLRLPRTGPYVLPISGRLLQHRPLSIIINYPTRRSSLKLPSLQPTSSDFKDYLRDEMIGTGLAWRRRDKGKPHSTFVQPVYDLFRTPSKLCPFCTGRMS